MNKDFETLREELELALGGLDAIQTQLRPNSNPGRWSIQQTVEHLLLTYAATEKVMEARITKGTGTQAQPSILQRAGQFVVIRTGIFPPGRKAPEMVMPPQDNEAVPSGVLIKRATEALKSMDLRVMAGEKLFGTHARAISHVVLGPLSISQWRRFHLIHARHHIRFIYRTRKEFGV